MESAEKKTGLIIINKSGFMGTKKPCNNCGKCKDVNKTSTDVLDNENDLEPLYPFPLGVRKIEGEREEGEKEEFEPLLPVGVGVEEENE